MRKRKKMKEPERTGKKIKKKQLYQEIRKKNNEMQEIYTNKNIPLLHQEEL